MQRLEVSGAVRPIYGSLGVKRLKKAPFHSRHITYASFGSPIQQHYGILHSNLDFNRNKTQT